MSDISIDKEALCKIEALFSEKNETPFDEDYNSVIESLSFSRSHLDDQEPTELKKAWTNFLRKAFESDTPWEWPCNVGIAEWYVTQEMPLHAIAVYEHLHGEVRRIGLEKSEGEYSGAFQEWLQRLFGLFQDRKFTDRALHVAELIGDFYEDGFFDTAEYAEVLSSLPALRQSQFRDAIERERGESNRRYREAFGVLIPRLHSVTERCLVHAELMSAASVRHIDPAAAPRCWALPIESEFHHKVYAANKHRLDDILGEKRRPRGERSCGIGQIHMMVRETRGDRRRRLSIEEQIPVWRRLLTVRDVVPLLEMVKEHRNRIAHVAERGPYALTQCDEFLRKVRESGWIIEFLTSLQPSV